MRSLPVRRTLRRRPVKALLALALLAAVGLAGVNVWVLARTHGRIADDPQELSHAQVAIVPGAFVDPQGRMSGMLVDRVRGAVALYKAGKVDKVLVSGDHGRLGYDEPDVMRDAVLAQGVPAEDVFTDYAGFSTWATMVRAREVFGVRSAVVVTQPFHVARAVDLGEAAGLDVHALTASGSYGRQGQISQVREVLARAKGVSEATLKPSVLLGPPHPITGDGRGSWGPPTPRSRRPTAGARSPAPARARRRARRAARGRSGG